MMVEKCSANQMGAHMLTKRASVVVVRYNEKNKKSEEGANY